MLFRGNVLVGYDFDTEGSDFDEMVKKWYFSIFGRKRVLHTV